eukprot:1362225-Amorphochlora_amoeboformis.AAC.1
MHPPLRRAIAQNPARAMAAAFRAANVRVTRGSWGLIVARMQLNVSRRGMRRREMARGWEECVEIMEGVWLGGYVLVGMGGRGGDA